MNDVENAVFTEIYDKLIIEFPDIFLSSEYVASPPVFPAVSIVQIDNSMNENYKDSSMIEKYSNVMFEINVYSNLKNNKKGEAKMINNMISLILTRKGFTRVMSEPIPNINSNTIYRIVSRYKATISGEKIYFN